MKRTAALVVLIAGAFAALYGRLIARLIHDWSTDDNYSHGFLIVPIALYFVWERRHRLLEAAPRPSVIGLGILIVSIGALVAGTLGAELFVARMSIIGVIGGTIVFLLGWTHLRILAASLAFLVLMIPIPSIIFNQIAFPLQLLASRAGEAAISAFSIPVLREGNVIVLANATLEVAEACSGIRSLISLLTLAIVYGYFSDRRVAVRTALAVATVPVAVFANAFRVAGTGLAAHYAGPQAAEGFYHTFAGWLVFVVALGMLFVFQRAIAFVFSAQRLSPPVAERAA